MVKVKEERDWCFEQSLILNGNLPVEQLADLAVREGRRPRPIYQTHKWFARRFGSAFRGLLIAAAIDHDAEFWDAYLGGSNLEGMRVADPFVGGGTAVAEAQRLGADCFASDVDPVAISITRFQSRLSKVPSLDDELKRLKQTVGQEISQFYITLDHDGTERPVLHNFWVQEVDCGGCDNLYDAHPHYQLAHDVDAGVQWTFCQHCEEVHELPITRRRLDCHSCGRRTRIAVGSSAGGTTTCPHCGHAERLIDLSQRTGTHPKYRLFALEYLAKQPNGRPVPASHRIFKRAEAYDLARYAAASQRLRPSGTIPPCSLPVREIPTKDRSDDRLIRYGYQYYTDLFNDRQLLHLGTLSAAIMQAAPAAREALSIAFCDHLKTNCMLASYAFGWRRLAPLFSIRAFRHISRPVELNPWLDGTGRGTYPNAIRRVERARTWILEPREALPDGGFKTLSSAERPLLQPVRTRICAAHRLSHIPTSSLDLVITDPPYFDNIPYSELSDFFLPWHGALGLVGATRPRLPAARLDARRNSEASGTVFRDRLAECFKEISRTLKPTGLLVFTYQHKTIEGWAALGAALASAEVELRRVFPMLGNTDAGPHKHSESIRWDAVIVAIPATSATSATGLNADARRWAESTAEYWVGRLERSDKSLFRHADEVNLRRACYAAALSHASNTGSTSASCNLDELLMFAESHKKPSGTRATTNEASNRALRSHRVPKTASA